MIQAQTDSNTKFRLITCFSTVFQCGEEGRNQRFDKIFSLSDDSGLLSLGSRCEGEVPERIGEAMSSYKTIEYIRLMSQTRTKGEC